MTTTTDNPDSYWVSVSDSSNIGVRAFIGPAKEKRFTHKMGMRLAKYLGEGRF